jgi:hypothetical protein
VPSLTGSRPRLRFLVVAAACCAVMLSSGTPSHAGNSYPSSSKAPPPSDGPATSSPPAPNVLSSQVSYRWSYHGAGDRMAPAAGSDWAPPPCWYEPEFTPGQLESYLTSHYVSDQNAFAQLAARYGADDYHKGEKGAWWKLEVPDLSRAAACADLGDWAWITPGKPPKDVPAIDPVTLAGLAYTQAVLPGPPVTLRPVAQNELVNLGTEVVFALPLPRVAVTASLDNAALGVHVAATTVAEPYELRMDAGTDQADPRTCTYRLTFGGGAYRLDTHGQACNVTYTRASPHGGYPLTASLVWKVHWTPSADADGPPAAGPALPDGESATPKTVTVRENVALNVGD